MNRRGSTKIDIELANEAALSTDVRALMRCRLARRLEEAGDYEEARELLGPFWPRVGERPRVEELEDEAAAEVLLRAGVLTGWIGNGSLSARTQEAAKDLITESLLLFERLKLDERVAEARAELATAYWREGAFEEARAILSEALELLGEGGDEIRALILLRKALVENSSTRFADARRILIESAPLFESLEDHTLRGKFHNELAHALQSLGDAENRGEYTDRALVEATAASYHFEQAGHARFQAHVENNLAFLFHSLGRNEEAHERLDRARALFVSLDDRAYAAQVEETRARVFLAQGLNDDAERSARAAAEVLEAAGEQALLAEALTTRGKALARLGRSDAARESFERAAEVAEQVGSAEGAGLAVLTMREELAPRLDAREMRDGYIRADEWLARTQEPEVSQRLRRAARRALDTLPRTEENLRPFEDSLSAEVDNDAAVRAAVEGLISEALERHGARVEFTAEAVEAMSRMFLEDGLRALGEIIETTVASAPRGTVVDADHVEVVALRRREPRGNFAEPWGGFSLKEELRQPERRFIELALKAAEGKISVAARLLGFNHNEILTSIIKSRYPELLAARTPIIPRKRSIIRKPKTPKR
jgi:tetratricopeptide (TPR) repeat protein